MVYEGNKVNEILPDEQNTPGCEGIFTGAKRKQIQEFLTKMDEGR
jgi:hypothetical protein